MLRLLVLACVALAPMRAITPPKEPAPNFRAKTLQREVFSKDSLKGKVVLIQFWATWCRYCRADQPAVDEIVKQHSENDFVVLAVAVNESRAKVTKYLNEYPRACKVVLSEDTNLPAMFEARSFPKYVVLDRDGNVAATRDGAGGIEALQQMLKKVGL